MKKECLYDVAKKVLQEIEKEIYGRIDRYYNEKDDISYHVTSVRLALEDVLRKHISSTIHLNHDSLEINMKEYLEEKEKGSE